MASKTARRRDTIHQIVLERGRVSVGALADILGVSMQTIRRDLDNLGDNGELRRSHGRIELAEDCQNTPFDQRASTNLAGKRRIAEATAARIGDGATLFLSIGSTALCVAHALRRHRELTVITNNLSAAMALSAEVSNRIILPGGEMRLPDRDLIGDNVVEFFGRYRAEFAVFGAAGIAEDGGLLEFHAAEVRACDQMRRNSRRSILVIDRTKFGRMAPALGPNISEVDLVICDRPPPPPFDQLAGSPEARVVFAEDAPSP